MIVEVYFFVEQFDGQWQMVPGRHYQCKTKHTGAVARLTGLRNQMNIDQIPTASRRLKPELGMAMSSEAATAYWAAKPNGYRRAASYTFEQLFQHDWEQFSEDTGETDFSVDTIARLKELGEQKSVQGIGLERLRVVLWCDEPADLKIWPSQLAVVSL